MKVMIGEDAPYKIVTKITIILAWIAVFLPGHMFNWAVERLFVAVIMIAATLVAVLPVRKLTKDGVAAHHQKLFMFALLLATTSYFLGGLNSLISEGYQLNARDLIDFLRYIVFFLIFFLLGNSDADELHDSSTTLIQYSLIFCLTVFFLYMVNIPIFSNIVQTIYEETKTSINFPSRVRITAPFENPNFLAFYILFCLSYILFFAKGFQQIVFLPMAIIILLATGSRSAWAASLVLIVGAGLRSLVGIIAGDGTMTRWTHLKILLAFILVLGTLSYFLYPLLIGLSRVQSLVIAFSGGGLEGIESVGDRAQHTEDAYSLFVRSPFFGWGPLKDGALGIIDNQYAKVISQAGLIGFLSFGLVILTFFIDMFRHAKYATDKVSVMAIFSALALMLATGAFLFNFRLFFLCFFFLVVIDAELRSKWSMRAE